VSVTIPDEVLQAARMSEAEFREEVAVVLYQRERLTAAQAARLAGMDRIRFQHLLASRGIPLHYDISDFDADLQTMADLGRLADPRAGTA
jgi:predicted HTH domain antitoxin